MRMCLWPPRITNVSSTARTAVVRWWGGNLLPLCGFYLLCASAVFFSNLRAQILWDVGVRGAVHTLLFLLAVVQSRPESWAPFSRFILATTCAPIMAPIPLRFFWSVATPPCPCVPWDGGCGGPGAARDSHTQFLRYWGPEQRVCARTPTPPPGFAVPVFLSGERK